MEITIYKTQLDLAFNAVYEDIETYLGTCVKTFYNSDFKYIQPALYTSIKISTESHQFNMSSIGNYLKAKDGTDVYFYYITGYSWKGQQTLELSLALDTLNTYWKDIKFSNNTHTIRKYKDRWVKDEETGNYLAHVDEKPEQLETPTMVRVYNTTIGYKEYWYLIYKTQYNDKTSLQENPISVYAVGENGHTLAGSASATINYADLDTNFRYGCAHAGGDVTAVTNKGDQLKADKLHYFGFYRNGNQIRWAYYSNPSPNSSGQLIVTTGSATSITFTSGEFYYNVGRYDSTGTIETWSFNQPISINPAIGGKIIPFKEWYKNNKTDTKLVKILQLPYKPFRDEERVPDGWKINSEGILERIDSSYKLETSLQAPNLSTLEGKIITAIRTPQSFDVNAPYKPGYETKLLNSAYSNIKFYYDNNEYKLLPERIGNLSDNIGVTFYASDSCTDNTLFKIEDRSSILGDYQGYLINTRSLDIPYYTNEYLNYERYGKAIDVRNGSISTAKSVLGIGANAIQGALGGKAVSAGPLGIIGGVIGGAINTAATVASSINAINDKITSYQQQSSSISGNSDVDIFQIYGKNKLQLAVYKPVKFLYDSIDRYFSLYGYTTDEYGIPELNTRYWSNYLQIDFPALDNCNIWKDFRDDIESRMNRGFRIFHIHNKKYDLYAEKENIETSITGALK